MADTQTDDPYVSLGRQVTGGGSGSSKSDTADPYVSAGRAITAATPKTDTTSTTTDDPYSLEHSWLQIPSLHNLGAGLTQGARDVVASGLDLGAWVDKRVPFLAALDRLNPLIGDPEARKAEFQKARETFEASPEGQSYVGKGGRIAGEVAMTLPLAGPVGEAAGAGVNALARVVPALPATAPWIARATTGTAVPWLARTTAEGTAAGGTFGLLTEGGSDQPVGQSVEQNALLGAKLGSAGSLAGMGLGYAGKGVAGATNYLTGRAPGIEVEAAMRDARVRAGLPPDGGPPAPAPSGAAAAPPTMPTGAQPAGAQVTPAGAIPAVDRSAELAGKTRAIDLMLSDRPNVGRSDFNEYVKGNLPSHPEGLGDAQLAAIQRQVEPGDARYAALRDAAKDNRLEHFEQRAGIPEQLDSLEKDIARWDKEKLDPIWHNKTPVDASGVETYIRNRLDSPQAQIGPVEDALKEVEKRIYKRGTTDLFDDPEMLYGARRQISYMLSRAGRQANPAYGNDDVMRELIGVRDQLDKAIEPGAQGFKEWVTEHANKMRDVDRMDVLQTMRAKLLGPNGDIQLSKLTGQLKALRTRMAQSGANPAHSLTMEDLDMLRDLNKDLLRESNKALAMPVGSPTAHNIDVATEHGLHAVNALAQAGAERIPGAGYLLNTAMSRAATRNAARQKELYVRRFLAPPPPGSGGP